MTENDLRGAIKSLKDVIAPAVDGADPLATEQLRLVVEYLEFLRSRLEFLADRDRFELQHHLKMAVLLQACQAPFGVELAAALAAAIEAGEDAFRKAGVSCAEVKRCSAVLAAVLRIIVRTSNNWDSGIRSCIERLVLDHSRERIAFDRSWFVSMGGDPSPGEVPALAGIIDELRPPASSHRCDRSA